MKLVTYHHNDTWRPGIVLGASVFDVTSLLDSTHGGSEAKIASVKDLLRAYGADLPALHTRLEVASNQTPGAKVGPVDSLCLGPPVTDPAKVLCIGLNYNDHVAETGRALPEHPDVFTKFASTLIGPHDEIRCSTITQNLDFEGELAIVIGKNCRSVSEDDALDYVAGVTILNDITARDLQYRGTQWLAGKAVDASTPCGPSLVTMDEVGDIQGLEIETRVNGTQVQSSNTRYMIFPVSKLVSYVSYFLELSPGDIITTGTPQGIGAKRQPPMWLKPGDTVEVEIQNVGILRNVVR